MFFALVANDRTRFEQILRWTEVNLADGDLGKSLPAWVWGRAQNGSWHILDENSAADADLWISYSLVQAGRLWKAPRYTTLGLAMARQIASREFVTLPGYGPILLPAPDGFRREKVIDFNPSYWTPQLMLGLGAAGARGPWLLAGQSAIRALRSSSRAGYAFDWVEFEAGKGFTPTAPQPGKEPASSFDAIRVYLWVGMLPEKTPGRAALLEAYRPLVNYIRQSGAPPAVVKPDGLIQGPGNFAFSAAVVPFLQAIGETALARMQFERYNAALNSVNRLYGNPPRYYLQNLILFAEGWREKRFRFSEKGLLSVDWSR